MILPLVKTTYRALKNIIWFHAVYYMPPESRHSATLFVSALWNDYGTWRPDIIRAITKERHHPSGLRPMLLFPLAVYPFAISVDLVLRLSWSAKLSSHLHSYSEGDLIIFWIELAEVLRRWMWVFIRVEWEIVKQRMEGSSRSRSPPGGGAGIMMADRGGDRNFTDEELEIDMTSSLQFEGK